MAGPDQQGRVLPPCQLTPTSPSLPASSNLPPIATPAQVSSPPLASPATESNDISLHTEEILPCVATARPTAGISIWQPRPDPNRRYTSRLKKCNAQFLALCDATSFRNGDVPSVLVIAPVFLSEETAREVQESNERAWLIVDAMHRGELDTGMVSFLHISRVGRKISVMLESFAVRDEHNALVEFLMIETPIPSAAFFKGDRINRAELLLTDPSPPVNAIQPREVPAPSACTFVLRGAVRKELQWRESAIIAKQGQRSISGPPVSTPFQCDMCSSKGTTQRRRVLLP